MQLERSGKARRVRDGYNASEEAGSPGANMKPGGQNTGGVDPLRTGSGACPRLEDSWIDRWFRRFVVVSLAAYLLFAHGCHGDADTDLATFISVFSWAAAAG